LPLESVWRDRGKVVWRRAQTVVWLQVMVLQKTVASRSHLDVPKYNLLAKWSVP
jgi:hypothetical protein